MRDGPAFPLQGLAPGEGMWSDSSFSTWQTLNTLSWLQAFHVLGCPNSLCIKAAGTELALWPWLEKEKIKGKFHCDTCGHLGR